MQLPNGRKTTNRHKIRMVMSGGITSTTIITKIKITIISSPSYLIKRKSPRWHIYRRRRWFTPIKKAEDQHFERQQFIAVEAFMMRSFIDSQVVLIYALHESHRRSARRLIYRQYDLMMMTTPYQLPPPPTTITTYGHRSSPSLSPK